MFTILVNIGAVKLFNLTDNNSRQFSNIEAIVVKLGAFILDKSILTKELFLNIFSVDLIKEKSKCDKSIDFIFFSPSKKLSNVVRGDKKYIIKSDPNTVWEVNSSVGNPFSSLITNLILFLSHFEKSKVFPSFFMKYIFI